MIIAVARETYPGERRVALVPAAVPALVKSRQPRADRDRRGRRRPASRTTPIASKAPRSSPIAASYSSRPTSCCKSARWAPIRPAAAADLELIHDGLVMFGMCDPLGNPQAVKELADRGVTLFALELIPRITRAQSMDVLSSMATIAGYKAVLLAADHLPKMFPHDDDRRRHAHAGQGVRHRRRRGRVAGDRHRRGGSARSCRPTTCAPAVKEQIESLGAKFVEMPLETGDAEGKGGYAKQLDEEFYSNGSAS